MADKYGGCKRNQLLGSSHACPARTHTITRSYEYLACRLLQAGIREIVIDGRIGLLATTYTELHRDPTDRFIVATAMTHHALLVTADSKILAWKAKLTTQDAKA